MNFIELVLELFEGTEPILYELYCFSLGAIISDTPVLHQSNNTANKKMDVEDMYYTVGSVKAKYLPSLSTKKLSRMWGIVLKTDINNLDATTHELIMSTELLANHFKTDKAQLQYKQIYRQYGTLYVEYIKVGVNLPRQFIGGTLYTNKLGFKKFFSWSNETSAETGNTLRGLIELLCLPPTLHSDNHKNFKEALFKQLLWKFGIIPTYTEPHLPWQIRAKPVIG